MEANDLYRIDDEETTTVDENRTKNNNWKKVVGVAAGTVVGAAAGVGVMAMVGDDDATTPDIDQTETIEATEGAEAATVHIAENNEAEAWPQKHDTDAWPQKHDTEAWPQKYDADAWPDDATRTVALDGQEAEVSPAVPFSGYMADMYTQDGHSLLLDIDGDGAADIAVDYDEYMSMMTDLSAEDEYSTVRLDDDGVVGEMEDELDDQIDIPDDVVDDLSSDWYMGEI